MSGYLINLLGYLINVSGYWINPLEYLFKSIGMFGFFFPSPFVFFTFYGLKAEVSYAEVFPFFQVLLVGRGRSCLE